MEPSTKRICMESTAEAGGHDEIKAIAVVVKEGDLDAFTPEQIESMKALSARRAEELRSIYRMVKQTSK